MNFHIHRPENDVSQVWETQVERGKFVEGINGAFLVVPFQCDFCWFHNIKHCEPNMSSFSDKRLLNYIRRVNLDLIWSRAPGTHASTKTGVMNMIKSWKELGIEPPLSELGPHPVDDRVGFQLALAEVRYSQNQGINDRGHLQYDSVRKLRTAFSHLHEGSFRSSTDRLISFRNHKGDLFKLSSSPTQSYFFTLFSRGLLLRMGRQTKVNVGLDYRILLMILERLEKDYSNSLTTSEAKREIVIVATFLITGFVLALRGHEIFMVEAHGLYSHIHFGKNETDPTLNHVVIPLLGRFKNEDGSRYHLMLSVDKTNSGIEVRKWVERLALYLKKEKRLSGPAFCHLDGSSYTSVEMNHHFHSLLEDVQSCREDLLPSSVDVHEDYNIFRSLRKGSTARATDMKVPKTVIDLHNRWKTIENSRGQRSQNSMSDYYTDLRLTSNIRLQYTRAL